MKSNVFFLAAMLFFLTACDLNDVDENGTFGMYFNSKIDGVDWAATSTLIGASLDNNGAVPVVRIHGDLANSNDFCLILFPPLHGMDTTITSTGFAGRMEFHRNGQTWVSTTGNLTLHDDGYPQHHEYVGTFSGTFFNASDNTTLSITNGAFLAQGVF